MRSTAKRSEKSAMTSNIVKENDLKVTKYLNKQSHATQQFARQNQLCLMYKLTKLVVKKVGDNFKHYNIEDKKKY